MNSKTQVDTTYQELKKELETKFSLHVAEGLMSEEEVKLLLDKRWERVQATNAAIAARKPWFEALQSRFNSVLRLLAPDAYSPKEDNSLAVALMACLVDIPAALDDVLGYEAQVEPGRAVANAPIPLELQWKPTEGDARAQVRHMFKFVFRMHSYDVVGRAPKFYTNDWAKQYIGPEFADLLPTKVTSLLQRLTDDTGVVHRFRLDKSQWFYAKLAVEKSGNHSAWFSGFYHANTPNLGHGVVYSQEREPVLDSKGKPKMGRNGKPQTKKKAVAWFDANGFRTDKDGNRTDKDGNPLQFLITDPQ